MSNKKKVFFVQGHGISSPTEVTDWPSELGRELNKNGFDFIPLTMPNPMYPDVHEWLNYLNLQNIQIDENTYFVGHSLGCITLCRYLEKLAGNSVAGGCVFVAGFSSFPDIPLLRDFCILPLDFSEVKKHSKNFVVVISDNDHVINPALSREFAAKLEAEIIMEHKKGHFIAGTRKIPSVLEFIIKIDKEKSRKSFWSFFGL